MSPNTTPKAASVEESWHIADGAGRLEIRRPATAAGGTARTDTVDASSFREALPNGTNIRCLNRTWISLQPPGSRMRIPLSTRDPDLDLKPIVAETAATRETAKRMYPLLRRLVRRSGGSEELVCWPGGRDTVWVSEVTLLLLRPIEGQARLTVRSVGEGAVETRLARIDLAGARVDTPELQAALAKLQAPSTARQVAVDIQRLGGTETANFWIASQSTEQEAAAGLVAVSDSSSADEMLARALGLLEHRQYGSADRLAGRLAIRYPSPTAFAVLDSIESKIGCP